MVKRVFSATWTRRIALPHPTSRVMQLSALVRMLLRPHLKRHSQEGMMDQYSHCLLTKVNNLLKYLTTLILLKNLSECLILILNAVTYKTPGLTLQDGVLKTTS